MALSVYSKLTKSQKLALNCFVTAPPKTKVLDLSRWFTNKTIQKMVDENLIKEIAPKQWKLLRLGKECIKVMWDRRMAQGM